MKKLLLGLFIISGFAASAQITLNSNDMPNVNDTIRYSVQDPTNGIDYFSTDTNYVWDFGYFVDFFPLRQRIDTILARTAAPSGYTTYIPGVIDGFTSTQASYCTKGNSAIDTNQTGGIALEDLFTFYKESTAKFEEVGFGVTISGFPIPKKYTGTDVKFALPINAVTDYGRIDSCNWYYNFDLTSTVGYYYEQSNRKITTVDGWGTLITPLDTFDVIRTKSEIFTHDSIFSSSDSTGFAFDRPMVTEFKWMGKGKSLPLLLVRITTDQGGNETLTLIEYQDIFRVDPALSIPKTSSSLHKGVLIYPNPYKDYARINYELTTFSEVTITVTNVLGEVIATPVNRLQAPGNYTELFSAKQNGRSGGVYFVKVKIGEQESIHRIVELD